MIGWRLRAAVAIVVGVIVGLIVAAPSTAQSDSEKIEVLNYVEEGGTLMIELTLPADLTTTGDLTVTENGENRDVRVQGTEDTIGVILALDTSGTMADSMEAAREAATSLINRLPEDAWIGIVGFGDPSTVLLEPTQDHELARATVSELEADGNTALWDALVDSAELAADLGTKRPYVVVLSDGRNDVGERVGDDQLAAINALRSAGAGLYAIGFGNADGVALGQITQAVGGKNLSAFGQDQLNPIFDDIGSRLGNRYFVEYTTQRGFEREVTIATLDSNGEFIFANFTIPGRPLADAAQPGTTRPEVLVTQPRVAAAPVFDGPALNVFSRPETLAVGLGAFFVAFLIGALFVVIPASEVPIDTAAGVDRMAAVRNRLTDVAERLLRSSSRGRVERALDLSGVHLRPGEVAMIALGAMVLLFLVFAYLSGVAAGLVVVVIAAVGLVSSVNVMVSRRRQKFADQLTDALGILAGSLRAGQSLSQAIEYVSQESAAPTADEFRRILFETRVGRDITDSMIGVAERMDSRDFEWVADAVDINREVGGDLTEVLDNVAETIRDRRAIARQAHALSAEGRATAWVLIGTPFILFLFLAWQTPENIKLFATDPTGRLLLAVGMLGMVIGYFWIRKLVNIKF